MHKVYGDRQSGNCYKVQLICTLLNIEHEWINVDILAKETQTEAFKKLNPNGKIPLLQLADGRTLSESNAIINYLARGSEFLPSDPYEFALVEQWQFFEQYSHEPYIAVARFIKKYLGLPQDREDEYKGKQTGGHKALKIMEEQLNKTKFIVGNTLTTADISLFAYTHVAQEGGFLLNDYPKLLVWIERIKNQDGYSTMR